MVELEEKFRLMREEFARTRELLEQLARGVASPICGR